MSPWSFLSDLVAPVLGSLNSYLPVFTLPEGVQHKLVAFVLRRTLGRFVKHDGLLARQVDDGILKGNIKFDELELDPKAITDLIPPNLPLEFVSGRIETALVQLPFPNLLSAPLSVQIDSINIHLRVRQLHNEAVDVRSGSLAQSVLDISNDFLSSTLSPQEVQELASSVHDDAIHVRTPQQRDTLNEASELPPTTVLASIIENVLSRLEVNVHSIILRVTLPSRVMASVGDHPDGEMNKEEDMTLEIRLENAKFSSEAGDSESMDRVLRMKFIELWLETSEMAHMEEMSEASSSNIRHGSAVSSPILRNHHLAPSTAIGTDGSGGMDTVNSIYESALGFDETAVAIDPFEPSSSGSSERQSERSGLETMPSSNRNPAARRVRLCAVKSPGLVFEFSRKHACSGKDEENLHQSGTVASFSLGHVSSTLRLDYMDRLRDFSAVFHGPTTSVNNPDLVEAPATGPAFTAILKVASLHLVILQNEEGALEVSEDRAGDNIATQSGRGFIIQLARLEVSTSGVSSVLTIQEAEIGWQAHSAHVNQREAIKLLQCIGSVPTLYNQTMGDHWRNDPMTTGERERFRLPQISTGTSLMGDCAPFLFVAKRGDNTDAKVAPVQVNVHMDVVEDMLPFVKQLSSRLAVADKERNSELERLVVEARMQLSCAMVRLAVQFPLQDRYYDCPTHKEDRERRIVLDMTGIEVAIVTGTSLALTFAGTHLFFGLHPDPEQPSLPAIVSIVGKRSESSAGSHGRCCIKRARPALLNDATSVSLPQLNIWLNRENAAGLQYMADDITRWLDTVLHGDDLSARDNIKLVSSRFFGPPVLSSPLDISVAEMADMRRPLARLVLESVSLTLSAEHTSLSIQGTGMSLNLDAIEGKQVSLLEKETAGLSGWLRFIALTGAQDSAKACLSLTLATIQDSTNSTKQTNIDLLLHGVALHTSGRALWMHQVGNILKPPVGVFADVTPSDVTKLVITIEQTAAVFHQPDKGGSLCFDIHQLRVRTIKRHHAIEQAFVIKCDEVRLLASDSDTEPSIDSSEGNGWQIGSYCQVAQIQNLRTTVTSLEGLEQIIIEIARLDLAISVCADSLRSTLHLLHELASSFTVNDAKAPADKQSAQPLSLQHPEKNALAHDLREKTYTPDTIKPFEGDLLDDDLPIDRQFLTVSRKGKTDQSGAMLQDGSDGITIHCNEWFDMLSDGYIVGHADLEGSAKKGYKQSVSVNANGCNLKINLHDGYDWEGTRKQIESKRKEMRERLRSLRELLASGQQPLEGLAAFSDFAFNSVHLGLPEHVDYASAEELADAIDIELASEQESREALDDAWQSLEPKARSYTSKKQVTASEGLMRHTRAGMEFRFIGLDIDYSVPTAPRVADLDASLGIAVATIEIVDHLPTSTWKTFLKTRPTERVTKRSRQSDLGLSRCQIKWYPSPQALGSEAIMKLDILPVRMHVDQDAIDFCKRFASFSDTSQSPQDPSSADLSRPGQFIQRAEVSPIEIRLDYKPKRINVNSLRQGHLGELINLFHFEDSKVVLRKATVRGVSGWSSVYNALMEIWSPDIRATQMSDLVGGAAPVRSLIKVGGGVADLILLPIEQYQKDGRLAKGLQRGGKSFAKTTTLEAIKLGSKLATGTQVILERAEAALRSGSASPMEVVDSEGSLARQRQSRYAEQPTGAREGLSQAYSALSHDLGSAVQTILAIPMEVHENASGSNAPGKTVIRAVPLAVVQTMKGVTNASRKTLQGIRNQLDSQVQQELQEKYK